MCPDTIYYCDYIIVVEREVFSCIGVTEVVYNTGIAECCICVSSMSEIFGILEQNPGRFPLIITDVMSEPGGISAGMKVLSRMETLVRKKCCNVLILTEIREPVLLKDILSRGLFSVAWRGLSLDALHKCMVHVLSGKREVFTLPPPVIFRGHSFCGKLSGREMEYFLYRLDGFDIHIIARLMGICVQTVQNYQYIVAGRLGMRAKALNICIFRMQQYYHLSGELFYK